MDDRFNTIAGWTLFAGIVALGGAILTGEVFHDERPETMGYPIEGVVEEGEGAAAAVVPIETLMASADAAAGEKVFAKCAACHTANKGGANGIGPNLWGVVGEGIGTGAGGFAFSDALKSKGGTWTFAALNEWLTSPRAFAPGTKMTFAGLSKPEDRANIIAFLNQHSDNPEPLPVASAATAPATPPAPGEADKAADTANVTPTPAPGAPSQDPNAAKQAAEKAPPAK